MHKCIGYSFSFILKECKVIFMLVCFDLSLPDIPGYSKLVIEDLDLIQSI